MSSRTLGPRTSVLLLIAITLAAYAGAFEGDFQFDDVSSILENPHLEHWNTFAGHLDHMIRPVLSFTFFIDRSLYGPTPAGYHAFNLLLHVGCGLLIYRLLLRATTIHAQLPFWVALVFLVHPMTTEAVTYISGRASSLMAFWYLLALFCYIKAAECVTATRNRLYYAGALLSFLLSLASKETAITFPAALLLWDVVVRRLKGAVLLSTFRSNHVLFWIILMLAGTVLWLHPRYRYLAQYSFEIRPLWENALSQVHAVAYSLLLFFAPWKQNIDHDLPVFHSLIQLPLLLDLGIITGLISAAVVASRRLPLFTFGLGWFLLQLIPTNSIVPRLDLLSERNLYLASFGLILAVVMIVAHVTQWLVTVLRPVRMIHIGVGAASMALVLLLGLYTNERHKLYRDPLLLWADAVQKSPHKARPHNNLGHAYAEHGEWEQAIEEFRVALTLHPDYPLAQQNLRNAYLRHVDRD